MPNCPVEMGASSAAIQLRHHFQYMRAHAGTASSQFSALQPPPRLDPEVFQPVPQTFPEPARTKVCRSSVSFQKAVSPSHLTSDFAVHRIAARASPPGNAFVIASGPSSPSAGSLTAPSAFAPMPKRMGTTCDQRHRCDATALRKTRNSRNFNDLRRIWLGNLDFN